MDPSSSDPSPRLPVVGVMGSGVDGPAAWTERALALGAWLAERGVHLLNGGGGGLMSAVSRGFAGVAPRAGHVLGILPARGPDDPTRSPDGYPNPWVEIAIRTHLPWSGDRGQDPLSRNHVNVLSSDVIVSLPGRSGTLSEVRLALRYEKPVIAFLEDASELAGLPPEVPVAADLEAVRRLIEPHLAALEG